MKVVVGLRIWVLAALSLIVAPSPAKNVNIVRARRPGYYLVLLFVKVVAWQEFWISYNRL